ncbi:MAG: J domain-containing protein [Alphaproteobacteria bacterium]|nr:J domain-containing protein [Alphaproteobacteria bacterium]
MAETPPRDRPCDSPGCRHVGAYRAPRSRALTDYYWFCLEHVRDYNRAWNYCEGMSEEDIEERIRLDTVWERPTWRPDTGSVSRIFDAERLRENLEAFGRDWGGRGREEGGTAFRGRRTEAREEDALRTLGLSFPLTLGGLKARYKELVKRFHPDTHGGDKATEEKLKAVIEAYKILVSGLAP